MRLLCQAVPGSRNLASRPRVKQSRFRHSVAFPGCGYTDVCLLLPEGSLVSSAYQNPMVPVGVYSESAGLLFTLVTVSQEIEGFFAHRLKAHLHVN